MSVDCRFDRHSLDPTQADMSTWPTVNTSLLTDKERLRFQKLEKVLEEYLAGRKVKDICKRHKISRVEIIRVLKRCLATHPDGQVWGLRALISHIHQNGYQRTSPVRATGKCKGGRAGALTQLFEMYPTLLELVTTLFLKKRKDGIVHESKIPLKSIHKRLLKACRDLGLTARDYPLSQRYQGRTALWNFLRELENTRTNETAAARYSDDAARKLREDERFPSEPHILRPCQAVEFDGHRMDLHATVRIPSPLGGFVTIGIDRFWILAIIEVLTRTILGYYVTLNREYTQDDVLCCVRNAITPWVPKTLTIPGLRYPETGGFPTAVFPDLKWALWDEFKFDNAKAHLSAKTIKRLCSTVGCAPKAGPVGDPNERALIERFFLTLEENGFHRLPSTTGSNPKDPRRKNSEKAALRFDISVGHIEELASVIVAQYNCDPHLGIGGHSPLEYLGFLIQDQETKDNIRRLPEAKRNNLRLLNHETTRVVRGNIRYGKRPYLEFAGVRYNSSLLAHSPQLIGKRLSISVDPEDPRSLTAFLPNGAELGILTGHGAWGRTPHTLTMRRAMGELRRKKLIHYTQTDDPIHIYLDFLATQAQTSKSAARQYAAIERAVLKTQSAVPERRNARDPLAQEPESNDTEQQVMPLKRGFTF